MTALTAAAPLLDGASVAPLAGGPVPVWPREREFAGAPLTRSALG